MAASTENILDSFLGLWEWPGNRTMATSQLTSEPRSTPYSMQMENLGNQGTSRRLKPHVPLIGT